MLLTTTNKDIFIDDLGLGIFKHPTKNYDLLNSGYSIDEILSSSDLKQLVSNKDVIITDYNGSRFDITNTTNKFLINKSYGNRTIKPVRNTYIPIIKDYCGGTGKVLILTAKISVKGRQKVYLKVMSGEIIKNLYTRGNDIISCTIPMSIKQNKFAFYLKSNSKNEINVDNIEIIII